MRQLWKNFGSRQSSAFAPLRPYTVANLRDELATLTGDAAFAKSFFARYVEGREVPDFATLLEPSGLRLVVDSVERPYLGASMDDDTTRVFINSSVEGGSMEMDGDHTILFNALTVGDIDGFDFKVDEKVESLKFSLNINGEPRPLLVQIGKENQKPRQLPLVVRLL